MKAAQENEWTNCWRLLTGPCAGDAVVELAAGTVKQYVYSRYLVADKTITMLSGAFFIRGNIRHMDTSVYLPAWT